MVSQRLEATHRLRWAPEPLQRATVVLWGRAQLQLSTRSATWNKIETAATPRRDKERKWHWRRDRRRPWWSKMEVEGLGPPCNNIIRWLRPWSRDWLHSSRRRTRRLRLSQSRSARGRLLGLAPLTQLITAAVVSALESGSTWDKQARTAIRAVETRQEIQMEKLDYSSDIIH